MEALKHAKNRYRPENKPRRKDKCTILLGFKELASSQLWKSATAEFLGTMLYVLIGCGAMLSTSNWTMETLQIAMGFGLAAMISTQMAAHISGGHLNPAVTMTMVVSLDVSIIRGLTYMVSQCAGGMAGAAILMTLLPSESSKMLGALVLSPNMTPWQGVGVEFLLTFALVFCIQSMTEENQLGIGIYHKSALTGFVVMGLHLFGVYWAGPMSAGVVASVLFSYVFNPFGRRCKRGSYLQRIDCMEDPVVGRFRTHSAVAAGGHLFPRFLGSRRHSLWDRVYNGGGLSTIYSPSLDYEIIPHFLSENNV